MKVNELRIGNLLYYWTAEGDETIISVNWKTIKWITEDPAGFNLVHSPIPLSEEWLLKFGGKPLKNGCWISVYNLKAELHFEIIPNSDEIVTTLKSSFCDLILDRIRYVHQLQNLYYILTGEELS